MGKAQIKRSPFFYVGDKFKLMEQLLVLFPKKIGNYYEPFLGGGTVFLNVNAKKYYTNDIDKNLISLHKFLQDNSTKVQDFFADSEKLISKYGLSASYKESRIPEGLREEYPKTYFAQYNKEGYLRMRESFNYSDNKDVLTLYLLLIYGFNRMLRFNSKGDFNLPVGNVDFNKNVVEALLEYFATVANSEVTFESTDFETFLEKRNYLKNDFVYIDPPYLITSSEYNKIWNLENEIRLLKEIDKLNQKGVKFALSNVTHYRGDINNDLIEWAKKYKTHTIRSNYISYHNNSAKDITEVLITNYEN